MSKPRCIYCHLADAGSEEHLWPQALGSIRGVVVTRRDVLCERCNQDLGKLVNSLLSKGAYSFIRKGVSVRGKKRKRPSRPHYRKPIGSDPRSGLPCLIEADPGLRTGRCAAQVVFIAENEEHEFLLLEDETRESLREKVGPHARTGNRPIAIHADRDGSEARVAELWGWIEDLFPGTGLAFTGGSEEAVVSYEGRAELTEEEHRAIGMIGLHLLIVLGLLDGREPATGGLRAYVVSGEQGASRPVIALKNAPFEEPDLQEATHLLIAVWENGELVVNLKLFAQFDGPPWWRVRVGRLPLEGASSCALALRHSTVPGDWVLHSLRLGKRQLTIGEPVRLD